MEKKGTRMDTLNKRKKARPKRRWEEKIIRMGGIAWGRDATVQPQWERMSEAYAQRQARND